MRKIHFITLGNIIFRIVAVALFLFIGNLCLAQKSKNTYNTTIKSAEKVTIKGEKGSTVIIYNANKVEIGKIVVEKVKTRMLLDEMIQSIDSSGIWTTILNFKTADAESNAERIHIWVKCNSPIISHQWDENGNESIITFGIHEEWDDTNGTLEYKVNTTNATIITLTIKSKRQIKPIISGIDG
jgi:hypothetical protein